MYSGTIVPLAGNATFTGPTRMTNRDDSVVGTVFADQTGTIFIEQSNDPRAGVPSTSAAADWDVSTSYVITASDGKGFTEQLVAPFWRVRYVNNATIQTAFRLHAKTSSGGDS